MPPAARLTDTVSGTDIHIVLIPAAAGAPVPTPVPHPFAGQITAGCCPTVLIGGLPAAVVGASATCSPPHLPLGGPFAVLPTMSGTVAPPGIPTVLIGGQPAAVVGNPVITCNDPVPAPTSTITGPGQPTVMIG
jgi:uncharacterized Zn-binding protein involved in type VI secretion